MGSISIRGVDDDLASKLKEEARLANKSMNQLILDLLKAQMGLAKPKVFTAVHHDLDDLFGRWSPEDYDLIQDKIDRERSIDQELWS